MGISDGGSGPLKRCPGCGALNLPGAEDCESCRTPMAAMDGPQPKKGLPEKILAGTLADLQPREAVTADPDDGLRQVIELMRERRIGCVLVINNGRLAAMVTERDLLHSVAGSKDPGSLKVHDVMRPDPVCLRADNPVSFAFHHMAVGGYGHIPVQMPDDSIRVVSSRDLLAYLTN